ncbi:MAG: tetratricopeptide repeat protein [Bacteroidota bacterium]
MKQNQVLYIKIAAVKLTVSLILFLSTFNLSASPSDQFNKANALYRSGNYKVAARSYESLIRGGYVSSALYYNLGNAYYKQDNIPKAILNYERALKLKPGDEDVSFNLRLANLNTVDKIEPLPKLFYEQWKDNFISLYNEDIWSKIGITALWTALLFSILYIFSNRSFLKKTGFFATLIFLVAGVFILVVAGIQHQRLTGNKSAIITETSAYIKSSPDDKSTNLFMLHAGTRIDIIDELKGWKKIRIANGNIGWISESEMEII